MSGNAFGGKKRQNFVLRKNKCFYVSLLAFLPFLLEVFFFSFELHAQFIYSTNLDGTLTIAGYTGSGGNLTISNQVEGRTVIAIGDGVFADLQGLKSVAMPKSLQRIGSRAFSNCLELTSAKIPAGVTNIGDSAFFNCSLLESLDIPSNLTSIGFRTFAYCSSLTTLTIPGTVRNIGDNAFDHCFGLTELTILNGVTNIGWSAFYNCSGLTSVTIPGSVVEIGSYAFFNSGNLADVTIADGVRSIDDWAFSFCDGLLSINLADSVTRIGSYAFYDCQNLSSITIPSGISNIESGTFYGCSGLILVKIPAAVVSIGGSAFSDCNALEGAYFEGDAPSVVGGWAFSGTATDFTIYYCNGASGFTSPTWFDYPTALWNCTIWKAPSISIDANCKLTIGSKEGTSVVLQYANTLSSNTAWIPLTNFNMKTTNVVFSDSTAKKDSNRFYRVVLQ